MKKRLIIFLSVVCLAILVLFTEVGIKIKTFSPLYTQIKPDVILVLGCGLEGTKPNPFLRARLDEAIKVYQNGGVNLIVVSGGKAANEKIAEAEAMKTYLIENQIPQTKIITENQSRDTIENIRNSKNILASFNYQNLIIISNDYHLRRASIIAQKNNLVATFDGVAVPKYGLQENIFFLREIVASIYHGYL